jgi:hypothetical protein
VGECKDFVAVFTETVLFIALTCITKRFLLSILYGFECRMAGLAQSKLMLQRDYFICSPPYHNDRTIERAV